MIDFSRAYQKFITGTDEVFLRNGVKFDGLIGNTLIEAKGKYSNFVNKYGEFYSWFSGKQDLIDHAYRQLKAADGLKIEWYFADEVTYNAVKTLFNDMSIEGIDLILKTMP